MEYVNLLYRFYFEFAARSVKKKSFSLQQMIHKSEGERGEDKGREMSEERKAISSQKNCCKVNFYAIKKV